MNLAKPNIQKMKKYAPPLDGRRNFKGILLDFNERTVPLNQNVLNAIKKYISKNEFQVYPEYGKLNEKIAKYCGLKGENILVTNGSDQGIDIVFRTFTEKGDEVLIPDPSFAMFYQCAEILENKIIKYQFDEDLNSYINQSTKLIIICNPNNPTGTLIELFEIEKILIKALKYKTVVLIDEAYFEFSGITAVKLINKYPNLIISRTFSKAFGLASLRIGYLISNKVNIEELTKVRGPYDICMPGIIAAESALDNLDSMKKYVKEVMSESKPILEKFLRKKKILFYKSESNFILCRTNDLTLQEKLKKNGFLVRPRKEGIRISIGTVKQTKQLIKTLEDE